MIHFKAYKFRIYPTKSQSGLLARTFGCVRFVWNIWTECFNLKTKEFKSSTNLRKEFDWMKKVSAAAIQQKECDFLDFKNQFFSKTRKKKIGRPVFKSKRNNQSYRLPNQKFKLDQENSRLKLEKIGWVKIILDRKIPLDSKFMSVTISRNKADQHFVSILVKEEIIEKSKTGRQIGLDFGLKKFITTSDNITFTGLDISETQAKIKRLQMWKAKKKQGSSRFLKLQHRIAKLHRSIVNKRQWVLHNLSTWFVENYDTICIEDLNIEGMLKNHCLAGAVQKQGWREFVHMLEYKCSWYGKELVKIGRFFPSSKLCHDCGKVNKTLKLSDRVWTCSCGKLQVRDYNAALNILAEGVTLAQRALMANKTRMDFIPIPALPNEMLKFL